MVCTAVTVAVTVGTLTTATGVTATLAGGVEATGGISETDATTTKQRDINKTLKIDHICHEYYQSFKSGVYKLVF